MCSRELQEISLGGGGSQQGMLRDAVSNGLDSVPTVDLSLILPTRAWHCPLRVMCPRTCPPRLSSL